MVVQAGPLLTDVPGKFPAAGGQAQGLAQRVDDPLTGPPAAIGAEVPGPVLRHLGGQREPGVVLVDAQPDIGVALGVLEQDVVPRHMPLDEGALQHQGLELRLDHDDVEVVDLGHHGPGLHVVPGLVLEVLAHPVAQGLGLAHIDHLALGVLHDIHPRLQGQGVGLVPQFLKGHGGSLLSSDVFGVSPAPKGKVRRVPSRQGMARFRP